MQIKVATIIAVSTLLTACAKPEQPDPTATQTESTPPVATMEPIATPEPEQLVEIEKPKRARRVKLEPQEPAVKDTLAVQPNETSQQSAWQPNEAHLFRGGELVNGLRRELGRQPSTAEMQKMLQTHMGLSALQAQKLLAALGNDA